jgi:hypothetical protein
MIFNNLPQEKTIRFQDQNVRVVVERDNKDTFFLVYLPGEDGHLRIHIGTDKNGNKTWMEGDERTERAAHIGELLEAQE